MSDIHDISFAKRKTILQKQLNELHKEYAIQARCCAEYIKHRLITTNCDLTEAVAALLEEIKELDIND